MWSSAPDGLCVGTGQPATVGHGDDQRGEPARADPMGKSTTDLWRIPMVRTRAPQGPPGSTPDDALAACHHRRVMTESPRPATDLTLGSDGYPVAGAVTRRPAGAV